MKRTIEAAEYINGKISNNNTILSSSLKSIDFFSKNSLYHYLVCDSGNLNFLDKELDAKHVCKYNDNYIHTASNNKRRKLNGHIHTNNDNVLNDDNDDEDDDEDEDIKEKKRGEDKIKYKYHNRKMRLHKSIENIELELDYDILPAGSYARTTNYVVTAHLGLGGRDLMIHPNRITLYIPNSAKNEDFAAVKIPLNHATVLLFDNLKVVMTGKTTPESALFALHMYRLMLGRVPHPVLLCKNPVLSAQIALHNTTSDNNITTLHKNQEGEDEKVVLCFLTSLMDFSLFTVQNTVGSGPITKEGYNVQTTLLHACYKNTKWDPESFPAVGFIVYKSNLVIAGKSFTVHIFEEKIVLMGLTGKSSAADMKIAHEYFVELIKPFVRPYTPEYLNSRFEYRYRGRMNLHDESNINIIKELLETKHIMPDPNLSSPLNQDYYYTGGGRNDMMLNGFDMASLQQPYIVKKERAKSKKNQCPQQPPKRRGRPPNKKPPVELQQTSSSSSSSVPEQPSHFDDKNMSEQLKQSIKDTMDITKRIISKSNKKK